MEGTYSLDQFVADMHEDIEKFKNYYLNNHSLNPEYWPVEMPKDNDGMWFEQFIAYEENS